MSKIENACFEDKLCGVCAYWQGERVISSCDASYDESSVGKCDNPESPAYGRGVPAIFNCYAKKDIR
ncbi:MAG: hypothetical protein ACM3X7_10980 [Solirubrobacterales bacterium]